MRRKALYYDAVINESTASWYVLGWWHGSAPLFESEGLRGGGDGWTRTYPKAAFTKEHQLSYEDAGE